MKNSLSPDRFRDVTKTIKIKILESGTECREVNLLGKHRTPEEWQADAKSYLEYIFNYQQAEQSLRTFRIDMSHFTEEQVENTMKATLMDRKNAIGFLAINTYEPNSIHTAEFTDESETTVKIIS